MQETISTPQSNAVSQSTAVSHTTAVSQSTAGSQSTGASQSKPDRLSRWREQAAGDNPWDDLLPAGAAVVVALLFIVLVAGPALQRYLSAAGDGFLPFTGLWRPSVESFIAVGLILLMAVILSRFPWFLYSSFQSTKKARLAGEIWVDLSALSYCDRLCEAGSAQQKLSELAGAGKGGWNPSLPEAESRSDDYMAMVAFTKRFEDNYGHRPFRGPLWSITIFYLIGWLMVLLPNGLSAAGGGATGMPGLTSLISGGIKGYIGQVGANLNVVSAAFLGSYIFSMTSLFRRYIRSDFKPTAITQGSLRFVTAVIAGFLLGFVPADLFNVPRVPGVTGDRLLLVLAFFMGIFALNAVSILWALTVKTLPELAHFGKGMKPSQLTELDGLDAWHEDRLSEAGIDSVRGLANVDFLDLLMGVRMPTQTLVDWVDQAVLRIHCTSETWEFLLKHTSIRSASDMLTYLNDKESKQQLLAVVDSVKAKDRPDHLGDADIKMLLNTLSQEPNAQRICRFWASQMPKGAGASALSGPIVYQPEAAPAGL